MMPLVQKVGNIASGVDMLEILMTYNVIMIAVLVMVLNHLTHGNVFKANVFEFGIASALAVFWPVAILYGLYLFIKNLRE